MKQTRLSIHYIYVSSHGECASKPFNVTTSGIDITCYYIYTLDV